MSEQQLTNTENASVPASQLGSSSPPSSIRVLIASNVNALLALGFSAWLTPFAKEMYRAGDKWPLVGIAVVVVLVATKSGIMDLAKAVKELLPFGKGK